MRPDKVEGLTREFKPYLIHEIRCPVGLERPGGYRKMLQQPSLELQIFDGFGELPCSFRHAPLDFIGNPLPLIQAQRLSEPDGQLIGSYSKLQTEVLALEAIIQTLAFAFIALAMERISYRAMKFGLPVWDHQIEFRWDCFLGRAD
jgi:hypothetical protein